VSQIPTFFVVPLPMFIACGNKSIEEEELVSVENSSYRVAVNDTQKKSEATLFTRRTIRFGG
jgi:hypothetical protein